ncbi:hypothetical protein F5B20DRAFT_530866 [Whalleya microplaca]|nr:hypothetical protein F5B20DRAFT_530866 [Whalleya microplaca]
MGISLSTGRWLAPVSFVIDFAAQQYGILSKPNMKDVHDANLSFFSPQPFFIAGFFFPQQLFQLAWLWRLWRATPESLENDRSVVHMLDFVPYYAVGNLCIATWMIFWNQSNFEVSNIFVIINSFTQLFYVFVRLPVMNLKSWNSILTYIVSATFAGIGVLDLLHNSAVAYAKNQSPATLIKVLTGLGFGALASASDWIFGGCLVYDLIALMVGQRIYGNTGWSNVLGAYAAGTAAIVAAKNWASPPYMRQADYQPL